MNCFTSLSRHSKGLIITAVGVIAVSPDGLLIRLITADSLTINFWRGLFYSTGMLVMLSFRYGRNIPEAFFSIGIPGLCLAALYFIGNVSFVYSITHTAVANTLFIMSTTPLFAALIAKVVMKKEVKTRTWIAIIAAGIGILIICGGPNNMPDAQLGNIVGLLGALSLAASFTVIEKFSERDLLPSFVLGGFLMALVLEPFVTPSTTSDADLFYLFIMGFVMLPIAFSLLFIGPRYISAPEVSLMLLLESILGPFWVWLVLNEYPGNQVIFGGAIVLATLMIHSLVALRSNRSSR